MASSERTERELAEALEQRLGGRTTELVMEQFSGIRGLAVKVDGLDRKVDALDHKIDLVEQRLTAEIHRYGRSQLLAFASIVALMNTALAAFSFFQS